VQGFLVDGLFLEVLSPLFTQRQIKSSFLRS